MPPGRLHHWRQYQARKLIARLQDDGTRLAAFRELVRRSGDTGMRPEDLNSAEVITCPQTDGNSPLFIVLTNFSVRSTLTQQRWSGYRVENPEELFGPPSNASEEPIPPHGRLDKRDNLVIYAFAGDGKPLSPFGGDNVLDGGIIADINGDRLVERVLDDYSVEGVKCTQVLRSPRCGKCRTDLGRGLQLGRQQQLGLPIRRPRSRRRHRN